MNLYGLPPQNLQQILDLFKKYPVIERVLIFGSRALGKERPGSDIDLALFGKEDIKLDLIHKIQTDYDKLYLPWKLDLVVFSSIENLSLKDHIQRVGKEIYCRDKG